MCTATYWWRKYVIRGVVSMTGSHNLEFILLNMRNSFRLFRETWKVFHRAQRSLIRLEFQLNLPFRCAAVWSCYIQSAVRDLSACHAMGHSIFYPHPPYGRHFFVLSSRTLSELACVAGVQRGGRGGVECEREARSSQRSRFALAFNFPPPSPLYAGHAGYVGICNFCVNRGVGIAILLSLTHGITV